MTGSKRCKEPDGIVLIYKHLIAHAAEFLEGVQVYLMCDGYSGYNKVPVAKRTACLAHIRRYLIGAVPKGNSSTIAASRPGSMYVNKPFELQKKIRQKQTGDYKAIRKIRLEREKPTGRRWNVYYKFEFAKMLSTVPN